ncbi:MAG: hypothetical protein GY711_17790 [bacterium]|nr:hypothetical protein [bacterium]
MTVPVWRRASFLASAALVGAGGLGIETLLVSSAGLSMGYGRSGAIGISVWIAGWAIGAFLGGRARRTPRLGWLATGVACAAGAWLAGLILLRVAPSIASASGATALGCAAILLVALVHGPFLPWLARAWDPGRGGARDVSLLFAANLAGSVAGATWIGFDVPAAFGRSTAIVVGGAATLAGAVLAMLAAQPSPVGAARFEVDPERAPSAPLGPLAPGAAGVALGLATAWASGVEWIGLRLGTLWLDGMQPALSAVLAASLLALALGAVIVPLVVPRDRRGVGWVLALAALGTLWFFLSPGLLRGIDGRAHPLGFALALLGVPLMPLGAVVPVLHRAVAGESGRRLGDLVLHEVWGAGLGVVLVHHVVVPAFGLGGALATLCLFGVGAALTLWPARRLALSAATVALGCGAWAARADEPALAAPALDNPAFQRLAFVEDADFAVSVVDDGLRGERTLLTDTFRATAVGDDYLYMRALGHLPLLLHPCPKRTGVLAFGTGTTAGAVSLHPEVERIDVMELSRAVCDQAHFFEEVNHRVLEDVRTAVHFGDGRRTLGESLDAFDVVTMEPLLPDSPFAVYLYTPEFYACVRAALAPGGLLCQWVPPHALEPETFDVVVDAFARSFGWSGVFVFGTQVLLVGAELEPVLDAARFDASGALGAALAELGLDTPSGVFARYVTSGARWPVSERALSDADPWIVYRPRRRGALLLTDLPLNLRRLRTLETEPPVAWRPVAGTQGWKKLETLRLVRRAREAFCAWDAARRGIQLPADATLAGFDEYLDALGANGGGEGVADGEVRRFAREVGFVRALSGGFGALAGGHDGMALDELTRAASLRPERAQVHLLVALAAWRTSNPRVARAAAGRAYQLCPRLLETPQGARALDQGLPPELLPEAL